ncbi:MAG: hypothetical protein GWO41_09780 [candidate division Zixibacteria bacterium]|nr:hypothetical protein [candidate division Zixibacteria bacterium]NIR65944.1 hypothetical protein [candidate division Zixibacteria bacterium]NIS16638.1 hypothetical protein [candidate division Zixibacteria bacterium]NIS47588.1 hypothetical protein [candidate division Zixibacteria bacterium]NIT53008.1 hypothetical protein [candidate division Zixibacteria bacterium]
MKCRQALKLLYDFLDNQLDNKSVEEVKEHLSQCKHCFETYTFEEHLNQFLREKCCQQEQQETSAVDRLKQQVKHRIEQLGEEPEESPEKTKGNSERFFLFRRPVFAVGFFAIIAVIAFGLYLTNSNPTVWADNFIKNHDLAVRGENPLDITTDDPQMIDSCLSSKMKLPKSIFLKDMDCLPSGGKVADDDERPCAQIVYDIHGHQVSIFVMEIDDFTRPDGLRKVPGDESTYYYKIGDHRLLLWNCSKYWYIAASDADDDLMLDFRSHFAN